MTIGETSIAEIISAKFRILSFWCVCLVVLIHMYLPKNGAVVHDWFLDVIGGGSHGTGGLVRVGVPIFFIISGYFALKHYGPGWYLQTVKRRFYTLIIPFFSWIVLMFLYYEAINALGFGQNQLYASTSAAVTNLGLNPLKAPYGPYWYLRSLFFLFCLLPVLEKMANRFGLLVLFVLYGVVNPSAEAHRFAYFRYCFSVEGLFYFVLGMFLFRHGKELLAKNLKWGIGAFVVGILMFVAQALLKARAVPGFYYAGFVAMPFAIYGLYQFVPACSRTTGVLAMSFPLYLTHWFAIDMVRQVFGCVGLWGMYAYVVVLMVSVLFVLAMKRLPLCIKMILFGGRW